MDRHAKRKFRWVTIWPSILGLIVLGFLYLKFFKVYDVKGSEMVGGIFLGYLKNFIDKKKKSKADSTHTR